ncbi:MAG: hypothetical protein V1791_14450 [Pseudomonadota bacterium]
MSLNLLQVQMTLAGLLLQLLSVFFVWRTVRVSPEEIAEMGAGAILGGRTLTPILGTRSETVRSALFRQHDSLIGLGSLCLGIAIQMMAMAVPGSSPSPLSAGAAMLLLLALGTTAYLGGQKLARISFKRQVIRILHGKIQKWRHPGKPLNEQSVREDLARVLEGLATDQEIDAIMKKALEAPAR